MFEALRLAWRRRIRRDVLKTLVLLTTPCLAVIVVGSGLWDLVAVFVMGAYVGMLAWIWDAPPEYIERKRRGAEGERLTAAQLAKLPDGWEVRHDLDAGRGNWDHVVAGPAGVFLLDSKHLRGTAALEEGVLTLRRHEAPDERIQFDRLAGRMRGSAAALSRRLARPGARGPFVRAVVVVWPTLDGAWAEHERVVYVSGPEVAAWLVAEPPHRPPISPSSVVSRLDAGDPST